ncbi:MAG: FtsX-like permease family protein [Gammaproteobacteria bacterium]|jgi:putative ABC transport system permease protein
MKLIRQSLRNLRREWRSGELGVLLAALVVAVGAISAVGFTTSRINESIRQQSGAALAADVAVSARHGLPADYARIARASGLRTASLLTFASVIKHGDKVQLADIRAATPGYPLRGKIRVADTPFGQSRPADGFPEPGEVWLASRLMAALAVTPGGEVTIGKRSFRVTRVLGSLPDEGQTFTDFVAPALLNQSDIAATGLVGPASRVHYRLLAAGPAAAVKAFSEKIRPDLSQGERLMTVSDANRGMREAVLRAHRFHTLAALTAALLAGAAIALAARQYARRETDTVAILKSLGMRRASILALYVMRLSWLGLIGGALGLLMGYAAQSGLVFLLGDLLQAGLPPPTITGPVLGALGTSVLLLAGFALPPLATLARTPPARVLRREMLPAPISAWLLYGAAVAAVLVLTVWRLGDLRLSAYALGGITGGALLLAGGAWLMVRLLDRIRGRAGTAGRFGVANIARRGPESIAQSVAFGLGLLVLLLLAIVRTDLLAGWRSTLPPDAPNHFFINIQTDQRAAVRHFFRDHGLEVPRLAPMVRARLTAINGRPISETDLDSRQQRWFVNREQNLSWSARLPAGNTLVAGQWWQGTPAVPEVSVAQDTAADMGFKLGDTLTFAVTGEKVTARIANLRKVAWDSFQPNFFLVFSPGALENFPATWITSAYLPPERGRLLVDFVDRFPSVTVLDLNSIMNRVRSLMDQAARAVEFLFGFTLAAGVVVLLAAVQASRRERRFESALLRALGASRRLVFASVTAEFALLGLLSGVLAAAGASFTGWLLATRVFDIPWQLNPWLWISGIAGGVALVTLAGVAATRKVVGQPPVTILRQGT